MDSIGLGAGVVARLREMGLPARGGHVTESPAVEVLYNRHRDELWFTARKWFAGQDVSIPIDEELIDELGKLKAEGKEVIKNARID